MNPRDRGRQAMFFGELSDYRKRLGLSKAALAEILGVTIPSLYRWEGWGPLSRLNNRNAEAVDLFMFAAYDALQEFPGFAEKFATLGHASQRIAMTQEVVLEAIKSGVIDAWDFGFLGIFLERSRITEYREKILNAMQDLQNQA